jgi:hypothetical protein
MLMRGLTIGRVEQPLDVEGLALHPRGETRGREQAVQPQRELHALLRGIKRLEVQHAEPVERRLLHARG